MGLLRKKAIATVLLAVFMISITAFVTPVCAKKPPKRLPILKRLSKYQRINLLSPLPIEIFEDETAFVLHGWVTGGVEGEIPEWLFWSEMTGKQKNEYLKTASFELFIDGIPVELRRFKWYNHGLDGMYIVYYAVFPSHTFTAGSEYIFEGIWSVEFNDFEYTYTVLRTIIPS